MNRLIFQNHKKRVSQPIQDYLKKLFDAKYILLPLIILLCFTPTNIFGNAAYTKDCELSGGRVYFYDGFIAVPEDKMKNLSMVRIDKIYGQEEPEIHYVFKTDQFVTSEAVTYVDLFEADGKVRVYLFCSGPRICMNKDVKSYSLCLTKDKIETKDGKPITRPHCIDKLNNLEPAYHGGNCVEYDENPFDNCYLSESDERSLKWMVDFCNSEIDESETNNGCGIIKNRPAFPLLLIMLLIGLFALIYPRKTKPKKI